MAISLIFFYPGRDHKKQKKVVWLCKTIRGQLKGHCVENHISANKHCIILWINEDCITVTAILINDIANYKARTSCRNFLGLSAISSFIYNLLHMCGLLKKMCYHFIHVGCEIVHYMFVWLPAQCPFKEQSTFLPLSSELE